MSILVKEKKRDQTQSSFAAIIVFSLYSSFSFFFFFFFLYISFGDMILKNNTSNKVTIESLRQTEIKSNYTILFVYIAQQLYFENHCPLRITHNSISVSSRCGKTLVNFMFWFQLHWRAPYHTVHAHNERFAVST